MHNCLEFSQPQTLCKHRKKVFNCFYKITSSKTTNYVGKDKKKIILLIKTYLPTTLIWQWDFSTDQSKLTFWNSVYNSCIFMSHIHVYILFMQTQLLANLSACTVLVILYNFYSLPRRYLNLTFLQLIKFKFSDVFLNAFAASAFLLWLLLFHKGSINKLYFHHTFSNSKVENFPSSILRNF